MRGGGGVGVGGGGGMIIIRGVEGRGIFDAVFSLRADADDAAVYDDDDDDDGS